MLAKLSLKLAWTVPVPVDIVGAHLQTYVDLQQTITTLRLCNRFGSGAVINKLPAELISEIESYVIIAERDKQKKVWTSEFKCHQRLCEPMDHFTEAELVELWCDTFETCFGCGGCHCDPQERKTRVKALNDVQRRSVEDFMRMQTEDEPYEETAWWDQHLDKAQGWLSKTGEPTSSGRGYIAQHSSLLLRNFGLNFWVTHTQPSKGKKGQFTEDQVYRSTVAYLVLPSGKHHQEYERGFSDYRSIVGPPYSDLEHGDAVPVALPTALTATDIQKFARAIKVLGITPCAGPETTSMLHASQKDKERATNQEAEAQGASGDDYDWAPKLRVLYSNWIDQDF